MHRIQQCFSMCVALPRSELLSTHAEADAASVAKAVAILGNANANSIANAINLNGGPAKAASTADSTAVLGDATSNSAANAVVAPGRRLLRKTCLWSCLITEMICKHRARCPVMLTHELFMTQGRMRLQQGGQHFCCNYCRNPWLKEAYQCCS